MTIQEFLAAQGLSPEEIQAVVGNEKQAKAMSAALAKYDEGSTALTAAQREKQETEQYWAEQTQKLEGSVTRLTAAERRAAEAEAAAASRAAYLKSLADQGYDVPKQMYEGAASTTTSTTVRDPGNGQYLTKEDATTMMRRNAPDLVSLTALSNQYYDLFGAPYVNVDADFAEAQKLGKPLTEYARTKYKFDDKKAEKAAAADKARIDAIVAEQVKAKEAELAAKYGSNPETRTPLPSKFDRLATSPTFKSDSWKSQEGRDANRADRLKRFENVQLPN